MKRKSFLKGKTIKFFGKTISASVLAMLLTAVIGSAALLTAYGIITTTATVQQSILVDGKDYNTAITHTIPEDAPGGEEFCFLHKIKNQASIDIPVTFGITCSKDNKPDDCGGITETIYNVPETTTLHLESKGTDWKINGLMKADLTFDTVNPTFDWSLSAWSGLQANIQYAIIYYGDFDPRFTTWGGNNPGAIIATFTTDASGIPTTTSGSVDLNINLPSGSDWNIDPTPDYCDLHNTFDDYDHCNGAKIWIVPTSDLTSGALPLKAWTPSSYLFETDLITYSDCSFESGPEFAVDMSMGSSITELSTKTKTTTPVLICYGFDVKIMPGTYVITTTVK